MQYRFAKHKSQISFRSLQCEQWVWRLQDVQRISSSSFLVKRTKVEQEQSTINATLPFSFGRYRVVQQTCPLGPISRYGWSGLEWK